MLVEKVRLWGQHLANQKTSGLTIQRWCQDNNISPHQFYYWKTKLSTQTGVSRASFIEVMGEKKTSLFFECNGIRLYIDQSCDQHLLKQCLRAMRESLC